MFHAVADAQKKVIRVMKPGTSGKAAHAVAQTHFKTLGFQSGLVTGRMQGFFHGTGHGLGLEIHERPNMGKSAKGRLKTGHVLTVEPGLYYPGVGGVRLEDVVLITENGRSVLSRLPKVATV